MEKGTFLLPPTSMVIMDDPGQEAGLCPTQGRQGESPWDPQGDKTVGKIWREEMAP